MIVGFGQMMIGAAEIVGSRDALWIWETSGSATPEIADFMVDTGFRVALFSIPPDERAGLLTQPAIDAVLQPFADAGIDVYLVGGDPAWVNNPGVPASLQTVIDLTLLSTIAKGIMLDVEPWALADWTTDKAAKIAGLMDLLTNAKAALGPSRRLGQVLHPSLSSTTASPLPTLPAGYGTGNAADGVIARTDLTVSMAYRNTVSGIMSFSANTLAAIERNPKPFWIGTTIKGAQTETYISYADRDDPWVDLQADMHALPTVLSGYAAGVVQGTALHAYLLLKSQLTETRIVSIEIIGGYGGNGGGDTGTAGGSGNPGDILRFDVELASGTALALVVGGAGAFGGEGAGTRGQRGGYNSGYGAQHRGGIGGASGGNGTSGGGGGGGGASVVYADGALLAGAGGGGGGGGASYGFPGNNAGVADGGLPTGVGGDGISVTGDGGGGGGGGGGVTNGGSGGTSGVDNSARSGGGRNGNSYVFVTTTEFTGTPSSVSVGSHGRIVITVDGTQHTFSYTGGDQTFVVP